MKKVLLLGLLVVCYQVVICNGLRNKKVEGDTSNPKRFSSEQTSSVVHNNAVQYLQRFIQDSIDVYSPVSDAFDNDLCRNHSLWFKESVLNNKFWALKMFDASSKLPGAGILTGNVVDLGNYDQCLGVEDVASEYGPFSGQHCMVAIGERSTATEIDFLKKRTLRLHLVEFSDESLEEKGLQHIISKRGMLWSVCVPSSCRPHDVELHLRSALRSRLGDVAINIDEMACHSRTIKAETTFGTWCTLSLYLLIAILVSSSTLYDYSTSKTKSVHPLLLAFSIKFHMHRLLRADNGSTDNLPALNGIKALSIMWVLVFHHVIFMAVYPAVNHTYLQQVRNSLGLFSLITINGTLCVESFFLISGLLVSYNFLKERERGDTFKLARYYFHRYIRLTPVYALLMIMSLLNLTPVENMVEAPYWRPNVHFMKRNCENWLYSLVYVHNYIPHEKMCLGHTWYLSVDMQLFWLSPLILYPLWKWPAVGKSLVAGLISLGAIIQCVIAYIYLPQKLDYVIDHGEFGDQLYYPTYARFTPWLIGVGVGYLLHVTKHTSLRLSRTMVTVGWLLSLTLMLSALLPMYYIVQPDSQYDRMTKALYLGLMRPVWALGLAWCTFALVRGYGGLLGRFFSNHVFLVISRLCYCIYLFHIIVIWLTLSIAKTSQFFSLYSILSQFLLVLIYTICLSLVAHFGFEAPFIYIESVLFGMKKKKE